MSNLKTLRLQVRISEQLHEVIKREAKRLHLKASEVARVAIARGLPLDGPVRECEETTSGENEPK